VSPVRFVRLQISKSELDLTSQQGHRDKHIAQSFVVQIA
jgi:hypothetical protein